MRSTIFRAVVLVAASGLIVAGCSSTTSTSNSAVERNAGAAQSAGVPTNPEELAAYLKNAKLECKSGDKEWTKPAGQAVPSGGSSGFNKWPIDKDALPGVRAVGLVGTPTSKIVDAEGKATTALPTNTKTPNCVVSGGDSSAIFVLGEPVKTNLVRETSTNDCVRLGKEVAGHRWLANLVPCSQVGSPGGVEAMKADMVPSGPFDSKTLSLGGKCLVLDYGNSNAYTSEIFRNACDENRIAEALWSNGGLVYKGAVNNTCLTARDDRSVVLTKGWCGNAANQRFEMVAFDSLSEGNHSCPNTLACVPRGTVVNSGAPAFATVQAADIWNLPVRVTVANASGSPIGVSSATKFDATKANSAKAGFDLSSMAPMNSPGVQVLEQDQTMVADSPTFARFVKSGSDAQVPGSQITARIAVTTGDSHAAKTCAGPGEYTATVNGAECGYVDVAFTVPGGTAGRDRISPVKWGCRVGGFAQSRKDPRYVEVRLDTPNPGNASSLAAGGFLPLKVIVHDHYSDSEELASACESAKDSPDSVPTNKSLKVS